MKPEKCNALSLSHIVLSQLIQKGDFCIDATAGNGHDTAFLCQLCGEEGRVLAFDIQQQAVERTQELLRQQQLSAQVVCASHHTMDSYAEKESAAAVVFNLGWLPGGDHDCFTRPATTLPALDTALTMLRPCGILSLCIYYGRNNGTEEKDAVLQWLSGVDSCRFTVTVTQFANRSGCPAIYAAVLRHSDEA